MAISKRARPSIAKVIEECERREPSLRAARERLERPNAGRNKSSLAAAVAEHRDTDGQYKFVIAPAETGEVHGFEVSWFEVPHGQANHTFNNPLLVAAVEVRETIGFIFADPADVDFMLRRLPTFASWATASGGVRPRLSSCHQGAAGSPQPAIALDRPLCA